ncbi:EthD family reductase [Streptomyces phaeochromogenes]|uniref:EthD family reductase n=1 Tax=Streptomyces phaeochromogenes TaxID=1923 RepID=UPI003863EF7C|nr:EthD family reductase [Streptomyces phaeochromogenes]WSW19820.1 EthD family reductase [Streptomyces phaeochromogenes]WTA02206.1 EthD family reductase [Streptomyces phaeochromogenes]
MYNLVLLAARPSDWTHERFIDWWRGDHAELTRTLPGLRSWRHTEIDTALEPRSEGWDGVSVLGFETAEDLRKALDSPEWAAAVAQVGDMKGRRIAVMGGEKDMLAG